MASLNGAPAPDAGPRFSDLWRARHATPDDRVVLARHLATLHLDLILAEKARSAGKVLALLEGLHRKYGEAAVGQEMAVVLAYAVEEACWQGNGDLAQRTLDRLRRLDGASANPAIRGALASAVFQMASWHGASGRLDELDRAAADLRRLFAEDTSPASCRYLAMVLADTVLYRGDLGQDAEAEAALEELRRRQGSGYAAAVTEWLAYALHHRFLQLRARGSLSGSDERLSELRSLSEALPGIDTSRPLALALRAIAASADQEIVQSVRRDLRALLARKGAAGIEDILAEFGLAGPMQA